METKLRKIVEFTEDELQSYPFPNPAKVTYVLNNKVLCQIDAEYFFEQDLKTVQEYATDLNASPEEKQALLEWYLTGHSILTNPNDLCDGRGIPMDYLNGVREGESLFPNEQYFDIQNDKADYDETEDLLPF